MKHMTRFPHDTSSVNHICRTVFACAASLALSFMIVGCSSDQPEETFPAPNYTYLPTLHLNVNQISINSHVTSDKHDLTPQSPVSPLHTLTLMAQQRLKATGNTGDAHFVITQAVITKAPHHQLDETLSVQLTVDDQITQHHGSITATVHQRRFFPSNFSFQRSLYTLNQAVMDDMNVELEYQVRKHLNDWLTDAAGTPLNATVKSQDLNTTPQDTPTTSPLTPLSGTTSTPSSIPQHATHSGELRLPQ